MGVPDLAIVLIDHPPAGIPVEEASAKAGAIAADVPARGQARMAQG